MKNIKIWPFVFLTTAFGLVSCGTNSSMPKPAEQNSPSQETVAEDVPQSPKAPRQLKVVTSTSVQPLQETPEEIYLKKIKGITVECISSPKELIFNVLIGIFEKQITLFIIWVIQSFFTPF